MIMKLIFKGTAERRQTNHCVEFINQLKNKSVIILITPPPPT